MRLNVSVVVGDGNKMESGGTGVGGRLAYDRYIATDNWKQQVDEALRIALVNLEATLLLPGKWMWFWEPGWPGVMLHEAVGHGLEGDFNRKETSTFTGLVGERVASKGVTVIDDGTIPDRRGSITVDDEGTPSKQCSYRRRNSSRVHARPPKCTANGGSNNRERASTKLRTSPYAKND